jgi:two-component system response regulator TctD
MAPPFDYPKTQGYRSVAMRILLVEDSRQLSDWLAKTLRRENYVIDCVYDGEDADHALQTQEYALVILDLSLPKVGGIDVLRRLRARGNAVPVLILTANDTVAGRVSGLNTGADDYLAKPFDLSELEARIRAQLRRAGNLKNPLIECGTLVFDTNGRQFSLAAAPLSLTPREHAVLEALIRRMGKPVAKTALAETVFGFEDEANPNAIEIYVHRVRKKLDGSDVAISTMRGLGYVLRRKNGS